MRGPAPLAQALYAETPESLAARAQAAEARRLGAEPALAIDQGRPTKRDRRDLRTALASLERLDRRRLSPCPAATAPRFVRPYPS